jgi:hypothetical protein
MGFWILYFSMMFWLLKFIIMWLSHTQQLLWAFFYLHPMYRGTQWRRWLRYCATSRKVAGSIPDGVIGIFQWHNPSVRTVALGLTQPLNRNEYLESFLGGKGGRCVGLTTLPPSCADCLEIWELKPPGNLWVCPGLYWDCIPLPLHSVYQ